MIEKEILNVLTLEGWTLTKDEVGESAAKLALNDRVLSVIPNLKRLNSGQVLRMRESVSTEEFNKAVSFIAGQKNLYFPLKTRFGSDFKSSKFSPNEIIELLKNIKTWGKEIDLNAELKLKCKLPTNSKGILPLHHLAALALKKDSETLKHYKSVFQIGDRLGFVPYITEEHISRALKLGTA